MLKELQFWHRCCFILSRNKKIVLVIITHVYPPPIKLMGRERPIWERPIRDKPAGSKPKHEEDGKCESSDEKFEVEKLLQEKHEPGKGRCVLVKWLGYGESITIWARHIKHGRRCCGGNLLYIGHNYKGIAHKARSQVRW